MCEYSLLSLHMNSLGFLVKLQVCNVRLEERQGRKIQNPELFAWYLPTYLTLQNPRFYSSLLPFSPTSSQQFLLPDTGYIGTQFGHAQIPKLSVMLQYLGV